MISGRSVVRKRRAPRPSNGARDRRATSSSGYALIDAMVALLIVSTTVILSLHAVSTARRIASAANEVQRARTLLSQLILSGPRGFDVAQGVTDGFAWRIEMAPTGGEALVEVCSRVAKATNETSKRAYVFSTLETCPPLKPVA